MHLLFNNAGANLFSTFEHQTIEEIRWLLDIKSGDARPITVGGDPIWLPAR